MHKTRTDELIMSCQDCVFQDSLMKSRVPAPCQSCKNDDTDKGYCLASDSDFGFVPIITRINDRQHARRIQQRAYHNGSKLFLLSWSQEKRAYRLVQSNPYQAE